MSTPVDVTVSTPIEARTYQTNMPDLEYDSTFPASGGSLEESHRIFQSDWRTSSWTSPTGRRSASSRTGCRGGESWQVRRLVTRLWLLDLPLQHNTQRCSVRHGPWLQVWDGLSHRVCSKCSRHARNREHTSEVRRRCSALDGSQWWQRTLWSGEGAAPAGGDT